VEEPFPNPSLGESRLGFSLPTAQEAHLAVFDVQGRLLRTLIDGTEPAGRQVAVWDGRGSDGHRFGSGVYFYRFRSKSGDAVRRVVLAR
jgi:hypothetical protein